MTQLLDAVRAAWGPPDHLIICDRFRLAELLDQRSGYSSRAPGDTMVRGKRRYSRRRKLFLDGPVVPTVACRPLLIASLSVAAVKNDDAGSMRLVKMDGHNNTARDDVAAALTLAAGSLGRYLAKPRGRGAYLGLVS